MRLEKPFRADLHCHSTHSDGTLTPLELVELAKSVGLQALSITDHDAISSYSAAYSLSKDLGIYLIPGVELSTTHGKEQIHILGYGFDPQGETLMEFCKKCRQNRISRNREIIELLRKKGFLIEESDIAPHFDEHAAYGRPHIATALLKKGYVKSVQEAFLRYIGEGRPCYVPGEKYSVEEGIEAIHKSQGLAVIAHPHLIENKKTVKELLKLQFDGLEAYYSRFPEVIDDRWVKIALEHHLFTTGGSDFHGSVKPEVKLGSKYTPESVFWHLWNHFQKIK